VLDGANYTVASFGSVDPDYDSYRMTGNLDATHEFRTKLPLTVKTGFAVDRLERYRSQQSYSYDFRPNGLSTPAALLAGNYDLFDDEFDRETKPVYAAPGRWISKKKAYELFQQHPDWFVLNEATRYQNYVTNQLRLVETVSSGYIRTDLRLLDNKLLIVTGVRYEETSDSGYGPLNDPSAQYQKDANGNLIRTAAGAPIFLSNDPLVRAQQRYVAKGTQVRRNYGDFYPSINASYTILPNLIARVAYARTIGRPNVNFITPGSTYSEPTVAQPTITVNNPSLKPWTADNFDVTLEAYNLKGAVASIGAFRKNIKDFFGSTRTAATPALLDQYGLSGDPLYLDYDIVTMANAGDAKISGVEFNYRQSLTFLPDWARGFQVFVNGSKMSLDGSSSAEFDGFNPSTYAAGVNFVRPRFFIKLSGTYQGETRRTLNAVSAANGIPADTYNYQDARKRLSLAIQYSFTKHFSLFGTMADLDGGFNPRSLRYAPGTPEYAKVSRYQQLGSTITVGVKGTF
jgi:TonB-dependent receptor